MKNSEILREAKKMLYRSYLEVDPNRITSFVCISIRETNAPRIKKIALVKYIARLLDGYEAVEGWLDHVVGVPVKELTYDAVQAYRHRWVDHMIAEFEAKGD